jgi:PD-(D/E)XK nuclease superfamily
MSNSTRRILTHSAERCYRACPRQYQYRYVLLRRPIAVSQPLSFGALGHRALEAWWKAPTNLRPIDAGRVIEESDAEPLDRLIAIELIIGYHARWADEPITAVAVEQQFEMNLVNPATEYSSRTWTLGGKLDAIVERAWQYWVMEHKFISSTIDIRPGTVYWQKLQLDNQISTYILGAETLGHSIAGCIYDVIRKPRIRPLLATPIENRKYKKDGTLYANQRDVDETLEEYRERLHADIASNPDGYYQRGEVFRNREEEKAASYDLWRVGLNIRACEKDNCWPRNPDSCWKYERACDYWPVCIGEASIDDPIRYRTADKPHEELKGTSENANNATAEATAATAA